MRTGVGHLAIVDADRVSPTNINGQSEALQSTVGEVKVETLRRHIENALSTTLCHITATFGMTLAGLVIEKITNLTVT